MSAHDSIPGDHEYYALRIAGTGTLARGRAGRFTADWRTALAHVWASQSGPEDDVPDWLGDAIEHCIARGLIYPDRLTLSDVGLARVARLGQSHRGGAPHTGAALGAEPPDPAVVLRLLDAAPGNELPLSDLLRDQNFDRAGDGPVLDSLIGDGLIEVWDASRSPLRTQGWFGRPGVAIPIPIRYPERVHVLLTDKGREAVS